MKPLRINTYLRHLEKEGYSKNTIRQYVVCMDVLKRSGIYEDSSSEQVYNAIEDGERSENTKLMYLKALTEYEKGVMNQRDGLLKGALRVRLLEENNDDSSGEEPVKSLKAYKNIITRCPNRAMRIGLRLQLESGLRVGEIASLKPKDITMREGHIWLNVSPQKTAYGRHVKVFDNPTLYRELQELLKEKGPDDTVFPTSKAICNYLFIKGGRSHDLRRYNSRLRYTEHRLAGKGKKESVKLVGKQLGHKDLENTRRYLGELYRTDKGGRYKKGGANA